MTAAAREGMMHIGELAERASMSLHTIRHYDEVDLLRPSGRSVGGFRLYTDDDLHRLLVIRRMKPLGFTLEEMRQVLSIVDALPGTSRTNGRLLDELETFIERARERRNKLATQLAMADEFIGLLKSRTIAGQRQAS